VIGTVRKKGKGMKRNGEGEPGRRRSGIGAGTGRFKG